MFGLPRIKLSIPISWTLHNREVIKKTRRGKGGRQYVDYITTKCEITGEQKEHFEVGCTEHFETGKEERE